MGSYRYLLVPLIVAGLASCIAIPIPQDHHNGRVVSIEPAATGVMTKQQVIAKGGQPESIWENGRIFVYKWDHVSWGIFVAGPAGDPAFFEVPTHYMLLVQFDENDRVRRVERIEAPANVQSGNASFEELVRNWSKGQKTTPN